MEQQISAAMKELVRDLVLGRFDELERDGRSGRASAANFKVLLAEYPGILTMPPEEAFEEYRFQDEPGRDVRFRIFWYTKADPPGATVEFDLWFDGQPGDLMIVCTCSFPNGQMDKLIFYDMYVP